MAKVATGRDGLLDSYSFEAAVKSELNDAFSASPRYMPPYERITMDRQHSLMDIGALPTVSAGTKIELLPSDVIDERWLNVGSVADLERQSLQKELALLELQLIFDGVDSDDLPVLEL